MNTTVKTTSGYVSLTTGTEGPKYDPYHYDEFTVVYQGVEARIRCGLGTIVQIAGIRIEGTEQYKQDLLDKWLTTMTGLSLTQWQKWLDRATERRRCKCRKCNSRNLEWMGGYPGEEMLICQDCNAVVDTEVDISSLV